MNTKFISDKSREIIDQYKNFSIGQASCSIPYFNNRTLGTKGALRAEVGKGSPKDIFEEIEHLSLKNKIKLNTLTSEELKKLFVDNNIGIDCSGFAYYILNEESLSRKKGALASHIHFVNAGGLWRIFRAKFMPEKNIDVLTLTHNRNSKVISLKDVEPGDIITMVNGENNGERNHILIINQIEYQNFLPITLHYVHSVAWPTDGEYGHGIHEGKIEILNLEKNLIDQRWIENGKENEENYTHIRAKKSNTELRRLLWF